MLSTEFDGAFDDGSARTGKHNAEHIRVQVGEKSRLRSPTFKKAKRRRKIVTSPDYVRYPRLSLHTE